MAQTFKYKEIFGYVSPCIVECYKRAASKAKDGMIFVEIGALFGKSTCLMAELLRQKEVYIDFYVIDIWKVGDAKSLQYIKDNYGKDETLKNVFLDNARKYNFFDSINIIEQPSDEAAVLFKDDSVDFLFLDGDHSYEQVKKDIAAWKNKTRIFAGHDYVPGGKMKLPQAVDEELESVEHVTPRSFWHERERN